MLTVVCTQTSRYNFQMYDGRPQPNGTKSHLFNQGTSGMYQRSCKVVSIYYTPIKFHTYQDQITITGTYDLMSTFRCYRIKNLLTFDDQSISILYLVSSHQEYITDRVVVNRCTMSNLRPKAATWNTSWSPSSKRDLHQRCGGKVKAFIGDRAMWMRCVCWEVLLFFQCLISFDVTPGPTSADRHQRIQIIDVCCLLDGAGRCYEMPKMFHCTGTSNINYLQGCYLPKKQTDVVYPPTSTYPTYPNDCQLDCIAWGPSEHSSPARVPQSLEAVPSWHCHGHCHPISSNVQICARLEAHFFLQLGMLTGRAFLIFVLLGTVYTNEKLWYIA